MSHIHIERMNLVQFIITTYSWSRRFFPLISRIKRSWAAVAATAVCHIDRTTGAAITNNQRGEVIVDGNYDIP